MERIDERSLDDVIAAEGPLPPRDAARIGVQVLASLATGHRAGRVHGDVRPATVCWWNATAGPCSPVSAAPPSIRPMVTTDLPFLLEDPHHRAACRRIFGDRDRDRDRDRSAPRTAPS
nr:hypothetical protein [Streptomyces sp. TLI_235]